MSYGAVVGEQYILPSDTTLAVAKKQRSLRDGAFTITGDDGNILYKLNEKTISLSDKITLYNASDVPIVTLHKKKISLHSTWEVADAESGNTVFTVKKAHYTDREGESYEVKAANDTEALYLINGDFKERHYNIIYGGNDIVAEVSKQHFKLSNLFGGGKHKYGVRVNGGADLAFVSAIVVIVDSIHTETGDDSSDSD